MAKQSSFFPDDSPLATSQHPNPAAAGLAANPGEDTLIERTVTINRPRQELYDFWRDFRNLPLFMENIASVTVVDNTRSHWVVRAPGNTQVEWDSILIEDIPGEVIEWRSTEGASVANAGRIEFRESPNGRGTWVTATIAYDPPGGALGKLIAALFMREPKVQARHELRRFKQLMETGEISTSQPPAAAPRGQ